MTSALSRRRRGPRRAFTEDEVLDAAQELLDAGGSDAASVRGIAKRLGVAPNTIYTYFEDKSAVIQALVERLLGQIDHGVFADRTQPWRQRVEAVALELRAHLAAHPAAVDLIMSSPLNGPHALALNERACDLFADAGIGPTDAARASYLLIVYVLGSMALEAADAPLPRKPSTPDDDRSDRVATDQYVWGLHRVLDGIVASTPRTDTSAPLVYGKREAVAPGESSDADPGRAS